MRFAIVVPLCPVAVAAAASAASAAAADSAATDAADDTAADSAADAAALHHRNAIISTVHERISEFIASDHTQWHFQSAEGCYSKVVTEHENVTILYGNTQLTDAFGETAFQLCLLHLPTLSAVPAFYPFASLSL